MQTAEIKARLREFFEEEFPNPESSLTDDTNLLNDWFVDSFGIVNTTLFLEQQFGIEISRADINAENFRSIKTLSQFVAHQLKNSNPS
jgi:acyl carrier protein